MPDLAERFPENPILVPQDIAPSLPDLKIECLLNPGVFRFDHKTWLLLRVAERPAAGAGKNDPANLPCRRGHATSGVRS